MTEATLHTEEPLNFIFNFITKNINILDKKREKENNFYELKEIWYKRVAVEMTEDVNEHKHIEVEIEGLSSAKKAFIFLRWEEGLRKLDKIKRWLWSDKVQKLS